MAFQLVFLQRLELKHAGIIAVPVERAAWIQGGLSAELPRRMERERRRRGGSLAIVRDVSGSSGHGRHRQTCYRPHARLERSR